MHTLKNNEHAAYLHGFLMFVHKINPVCGKYATHTIKNMNWLKSNKSYAIRFQQLIVLLNNKNLILDFKNYNSNILFEKATIAYLWFDYVVFRLNNIYIHIYVYVHIFFRIWNHL